MPYGLRLALRCWPALVSTIRALISTTASSCLESSPWPIASGIAAVLAGAGLIIAAAFVPAIPTSEQEDLDLAEGYNQKLKPPARPVTAFR